MKWASSASDAPVLEMAVAAAAADVHAQLGSCPADLVFVFASAHHAADYQRLPALVHSEMGSGVLLGCSAGGVIGGGHEIERRPGLSLTAAFMPGVTIEPLRLENGALPGPEAEAAAWRRLVGADSGCEPHFVVFPDPFTFDAETFVGGLDLAYPGSTTIGGVVSGGRQPGENALFLGDRVLRDGLVGAALHGNLAVDAIVAQGCRPIGLPMFVTASERNVIRTLDGRAPLAVIEALHEQLDARDRQLARHSLFLGVVMKRDRQEYRQGDFLIRNLIGIDPRSGALAIGALVEPGAVVQFHLRDAETSAQDLSAMLTRHQASEQPPAQGALLFSCLGRGQFLYGRVDHDTDAFRRHVGDVPLGGFFCNGEIGPVSGTTFLHGYTSAFGLFRAKDS